jgi:hypothetical protein
MFGWKISKGIREFKIFYLIIRRNNVMSREMRRSPVRIKTFDRSPSSGTLFGGWTCSGSSSFSVVLLRKAMMMAASSPPIVADANAQAILIDAYQGGHPENPAIHASRVSQRKAAAENLYQNNQITELEFGQEVLFHAEQMASILPGPPAVDETVAAAMARFTMRLENMEARQLNSVVRDSTEVLYPIRNDAGEIHPNFPATKRDLNNLLGSLYQPVPSASIGFYEILRNTIYSSSDARVSYQNNVWGSILLTCNERVGKE